MFVDRRRTAPRRIHNDRNCEQSQSAEIKIQFVPCAYLIKHSSNFCN